MPASMTIDQAGLPAGVPNFARTDGLATGALVTLESVGGGFSHRFELLWVPPTDVTAVASLAPTGPTIWTFSPQALRYGSYRVLLVVNEGTATESRQILTFVVRTPIQSLIIPAANERADPNATILTAGGATILASEQNEPFAPFVLGSSWGWWRALSELIAAVEAGGGGGGSAPRPYTVIVGNALAGDTLANCDILDPGDCSTFAAALGSVSGPGGGSVFIRDGNYNVGPAVAVPFVFPSGVAVIGSGSRSCIVTGRQTDRRIFIAGGLLQGITVTVPTATPGAASGLYPVVVNGGSLDDVQVLALGLNPADLTDTIIALVRVTNANARSFIRNVAIQSVSRLNAGNPTPLQALIIIGGTQLQITAPQIFGADQGVVFIGGLQHTINGGSVGNTVERGIEINGGTQIAVAGVAVDVDSSTWGNPNWGLLVDGNAKRCTFTGCTVNQVGVGLAVLLSSSGASATGNHAITGCALNGDLGNLFQVELSALEAGSTVVGNTIPGGAVNDLGVLNEVAHNSTFVIP